MQAGSGTSPNAYALNTIPKFENDRSSSGLSKGRGLGSACLSPTELNCKLCKYVRNDLFTPVLIPSVCSSLWPDHPKPIVKSVLLNVPGLQLVVSAVKTVHIYQHPSTRINFLGPARTQLCKLRTVPEPRHLSHGLFQGIL